MTSGSETHDLVNKHEFFDTVLMAMNYPSTVIEDRVFEDCTFVDANFAETQFIRCKFIGCEFKNCNLSAAQFEASTFSDVVFTESKLIGINWTKLRWPMIHLSCPMQFYRSNLSHCSFYGLALRDIVMEECLAHDVDFRTADLSGSSFMSTDFGQSQFVHTKLRGADFTDAINYQFDPRDNDIEKAKFSLPDVINLLASFNIEITNQF